MTTPTGYARMAELHWREHCPRTVRELEKTGRLAEALLEAEERTLADLTAAMKAARGQGLTPQQAYDQAWELVRERYILIPPEQQD